MVNRSIPGTSLRDTPRNRRRIQAFIKRRNFKARREQQRWGYKFRQLAEMPYYSRTYRNGRFSITRWGPWEHNYQWSRTIMRPPTPLYRPPQVVDTSRERRPLVGPVKPGSYGNLPSTWNSPDLSFEQSNRDWNITAPFRLPWNKPEVVVEKPVPGTNYVTWKKGGFQYYRNRSTYRIDFVIPRWNLPLHNEFPGGREWSEIPGRPPRWFNIVDKILRSFRYTNQGTDEKNNGEIPCYYYDVYQKKVLPCSEKVQRQAQIRYRRYKTSRPQHERHHQYDYRCRCRNNHHPVYGYRRRRVFRPMGKWRSY